MAATNQHTQASVGIEYLHASRHGNGAMVAEEFRRQMAAKGLFEQIVQALFAVGLELQAATFADDTTLRGKGVVVWALELLDHVGILPGAGHRAGLRYSCDHPSPQAGPGWSDACGGGGCAAHGRQAVRLFSVAGPGVRILMADATAAPSEGVRNAVP